MLEKEEKHIPEPINLKGFKLDQNALYNRFGFEMNDYEWKRFKTVVEQSWKEREFSLEKVIIDHIKNGLNEIGFAPRLSNDRLVFERKK